MECARAVGFAPLCSARGSLTRILEWPHRAETVATPSNFSRLYRRSLGSGRPVAWREQNSTEILRNFPKCLDAVRQDAGNFVWRHEPRTRRGLERQRRAREAAARDKATLSVGSRISQRFPGAGGGGESRENCRRKKAYPGPPTDLLEGHGRGIHASHCSQYQAFPFVRKSSDGHDPPFFASPFRSYLWIGSRLPRFVSRVSLIPRKFRGVKS